MNESPNGITQLLRTSESGFSNLINQRVESVRGYPMFSGIPLADCAHIVRLAHERHYARATTIFFEGDAVQQVFLLTSGCVKFYKSNPDGCEVILRLIGPGDSFNAGPCMKCPAHCSTARTVERSSALVWETKTFETIVKQFPALYINIWSDLQQHLDELEERFREISSENVALRLSSQLVRLLTQVGKQSNGHVEIALSQRELAQLTGSSPFTVNRLLCRWESLGIVKPRREALLVLNVPALVEISRS